MNRVKSVMLLTLLSLILMRLLTYCLSFSHLFYMNNLCRINGFFH